MTPTVGGAVNETFFEIYDTTVQQALSSGPDVFVIVDLVSRVVKNRIPSVLNVFKAQLCSLEWSDHRSRWSYQ